MRLFAHAFVALLLFAVTSWWVLTYHPLAGPVIYVISPGRGVHLGDLPSLVLVALGLRSLNVAEHILRGR